MNKRYRQHLWKLGDRVRQKHTRQGEYVYRCNCCADEHSLRYIHEFEEVLCKRCCLKRPVCETPDCAHLAVTIYRDGRDTKCRECTIIEEPIEVTLVRSPMGEYVNTKKEFDGYNEFYQQVADIKIPNEPDWHDQIRATAEESKFLKARRIRKLEADAEQYVKEHRGR